MYTRTKTFQNKDGTTRTYLQIVQTRRIGNKVRQKVIANLGRLEELQEGSLDRLIEGLTRYSLHQWVKLNAGQLAAKRARQWGPAIIFGHLWQELGLEEIINKVTGHHQTDYTLAAFTMVLNRLCDPRSKRGVDKWVDQVYSPGLENLRLHHYYRALDYLAEHKDEIEEELFAQIRNLFDLKLDLVFWDTTTTYFEGRGSAMSEKGYSKDKRPDCQQLVIGVLMTQDGFTVAHQVFPGNMADIDTFRHCMKDVTNRFLIGRVILVADRGMVSRKLLGEIQEAGLSYIVGIRMRKAKAMAEVLSRPGRYQQVAENLKVKEVLYQKERYIICHNPLEAKKDQLCREEMLTSLARKLKGGPKKLVGNRGFRRFLKIQNKAITIDQELVSQEARFDGKYVLKTNTTLTPSEVASSYKSLWQVERAFRELKSNLELRPVYHWNDRRVEGHIMVCFLALVLESALCRRLKEAGSAFSYLDLMDDLSQLQAVEVELVGKRFLARTEMAGDTYEVFKALKIRPPKLIQEIPSE